MTLSRFFDKVLTYASRFQAIGRTELVSKKKTYGDRARDEAKRTAFIAELGDAKAAHYVYIDESGMDGGEMTMGILPRGNIFRH